jgi:hypothetical protein
MSSNVSHKCTQCAQEFPSAVGLSIHYTKKHTTPATTHQCQGCQTHLSSAYSLRRHQATCDQITQSRKRKHQSEGDDITTKNNRQDTNKYDEAKGCIQGKVIQQTRDTIQVFYKELEILLEMKLALKLCRNHYYLKYATPYVLGCWIRHKVYQVLGEFNNTNEFSMVITVERRDQSYDVIARVNLAQIVKAIKNACRNHIELDMTRWGRLNLEYAQQYYPHPDFESLYKQFYSNTRWIQSEFDTSCKHKMMTQQLIEGFRNANAPDNLLGCDGIRLIEYEEDEEDEDEPERS